MRTFLGETAPRIFRHPLAARRCRDMSGAYACAQNFTAVRTLAGTACDEMRCEKYANLEAKANFVRGVSVCVTDCCRWEGVMRLGREEKWGTSTRTDDSAELTSEVD